MRNIRDKGTKILNFIKSKPLETTATGASLYGAKHLHDKNEMTERMQTFEEQKHNENKESEKEKLKLEREKFELKREEFEYQKQQDLRKTTQHVTKQDKTDDAELSGEDMQKSDPNAKIDEYISDLI